VLFPEEPLLHYNRESQNTIYRPLFCFLPQSILRLPHLPLKYNDVGVKKSFDPKECHELPRFFASTSKGAAVRHYIKFPVLRT
jgi:hypothetical protein